MMLMYYAGSSKYYMFIASCFYIKLLTISLKKNILNSVKYLNYVQKEMLTISIIERKQREQAQMREDILMSARKIMKSQGIDNISIRKIADMIEYSPAIIYHYFKNKDEIIEKIIEEDYKQIIDSVSSLKNIDMSIDDRARISIRKYITMAVSMGDSYKFIMTDNSPNILAHTSVLESGASAKRSAIEMLCKTLRQFPNFSKESDEQVELTAQIIWSTIFGLAMRMIVEHIDCEQQKKLIDNTADFILHSLRTIND